MSLALIWITAALLYAGFYAWYVGFKRKLAPDEVARGLQQLEAHWSPERIAPVRAFLSEDSGRDLFIANYVKLVQQTADGETGRQAMQKYQRPFLKGILPRACHPIAVGLAASQAVEMWGIDKGEQWTVAAFVRYRSRRDLMEILLSPQFQDIHPFKQAAVEKTIAFICDPAFIVGGGPKITVPLALVALAACSSLFVH